MRVQTCVPYFGTDATRVRNVNMVLALYAQDAIEFPAMIVQVIGPPTPIIGASVARARNVAKELTCDVIVFNDADSLCKPEQIREAVRLATDAPGLVFAFTNYCRLSQKTTESLTSWRDAFEAPVEWEMYGSNSSGCIAISRESFLQVGGYDETWLDGYEDYDFAFGCAEMFGPNRRVEGDLIHLWHPRPAVEPENGRDRERFEKKWLVSR